MANGIQETAPCPIRAYWEDRKLFIFRKHTAKFMRAFFHGMEKVDGSNPSRSTKITQSEPALLFRSGVCQFE